MTLRIAVAQINCTVGDLAGNAALIREAAAAARGQGASLLLTPELSLCGYPPEDLLLRPDFHAACEQELDALAEASCGIDILVGHPLLESGEAFNAATLLRDGKRLATYRKMSLPNYEVFDEVRYFTPGEGACVVDVSGVKVGINICEDVWEAGAAEAARAAGAEVLLVLNASPFHMDKQSRRIEVMRARVQSAGIAALYCNMVGGQDELVFDGASFALDADGGLSYQAPAFESRLDLVGYENGRFTSTVNVPRASIEAEVYEALKTGVRDYVGKNRFPGVIIGLSGGVDSALTLAIAADALGADKVRAVMMPSPYTAQMSLDDSREMIRLLGVRYDELAIEPAMKTFEAMLTPLFEGKGADTTEENLQARIRGMSLMALSNKFGSIVLTTGNKSEMAVGYATLYGDMAGGFAVIKDILKTFVYRLCAYRNSLGRVIPENILTRAPSAELKPDQKDQDSLPPYEVLDAIIEAYMERNESPAAIVAAGYPEQDVRRVIGMLRRNEYKRRQSPVGIRVTQRGFGRDWRNPITNRYTDRF
ncbi:NAD+ synthase [Uliginosibacterium paludis]|uniref:Glutamine-dependent NAD(+) synthetase n=1 Tax=Uliginosibacterium paludis TaxID=1615952 RepID=A0ABV2CJY7_9RHOO